MNTQTTTTFNAYQWGRDGVRKVVVTAHEYQVRNDVSISLASARLRQHYFFGRNKPRVAPRMGVGVAIAQEVAHAHA